MNGKTISTEFPAPRRLNRRNFLIGTAGFLMVAAFPWKHFLRQLRFSPIPVENHSPNAALGHRLRDRGFADSPARTESAPLVIVGGGIAGLSTAWWLTRNGFNDYLLLELEGQVGGNSSSGENAVSAYPWAAHYLPVPNAESKWVRLFLEEIGVIVGSDAKGRPIFDETMICHDAVERLWMEGKFQDGIVPHTGLDNIEREEFRAFFEEMRRFAALKGSDGKPIFAIPIAEGSRDRFTAIEVAALDGISMSEWLERKGFRGKPLRWYANYGCRDDFGSDLESTSAWAGIHYHAARRGFAANADPTAILTWPAGNGWLTEKLRALLTGKIRTGEIATSVLPPEKAGEPTIVLTHDARSGESRRIEAESVVIAAPRFVANRLLPEKYRTPLEGAGPGETLNYAPWMVANLTVRDLPGTNGEGKTELGAWDNVSYYSESLGYVVATHQTSTIGRSSVLTHYWPLTELPPKEARRVASARSPEEWREKILVDLEVMHPEIRAIVERIDYRVWGHGMISPSPGYLSGPTRARLENSIGRVHFAHSDISGMSIFEEAQYRGVLAAKRVLAEFGRTERREKV